MGIRERLSGNEAIAYAMKQINPDVMGAFPITPSTEIPQYFSQYAANGDVDTEFVPVESEHSAMSCCIGAQAAGGRAVTATSSAGLALMWEMLYVAASCRLPITLACVNRALTGPININNDHSDSMGARDCGWIQLYAENNQEAYDNFLMAMRVGEHPDVRLPVMVCQDGFITSHAIENIELVEDKKASDFVGEYTPENFLLNKERPLSVGPYDVAAYYMEHKMQQAVGMKNARQVILEVAKKFAGVTDRSYGFFEEYRMEGAERAIVLIGSSAGTAKAAVDELRAAGEKAGLIKLRVFRPFPMEELATALAGVKAVAVMDKAERFSGGHRMCAGCGSPVAVRGVLRALNPEDKAVISCATGCLEVSSFLYPYTAWQDSFIHTAFENAGATISGVEACYKALRKKGKVDETYKFIAFGGDGGTYDIGFQSLSGAMERGHDMVYVCYDNEAYMNTGIQRSSSTPKFADATTSPVGSAIPGKLQNKKDLTEVIAAHSIPYVAQTTFLTSFKDLHEKAHKAIYTPGAAFLNVLAPCPRGWRYPTEDLMEITRLAVETCVWPLYEVENGEWRLTYQPKNKLPVDEYLKPQGRFAHLFQKGNEWMLEELQKDVDRKWAHLLQRCKN